MIRLLAVLLLPVCATAARTVTLVDELVRVGAGDVRPVPFELRRRGAVVEMNYQVESGGSGVRVAVMNQDEKERLMLGQSHTVLAATAFARSGRLRVKAPAAGWFYAVIDNRLEGRGSSEVRCRIQATYLRPPRNEPQVLPARRRAVVVFLSLAFLVAACWWAGRRLLRAAANRDREAPPPAMFC